MKKFFTLIMAVAAVASAVAVNPVKEVKAKAPVMRQVANVAPQSRQLENTMFIKADKATKGRKVARRADEAYTLLDSAYTKPAGSFFEYPFWQGTQWGYMYGRELIPAYTEVTYQASTLGDSWEYFPNAWPEDEEDATLLKSGKSLTFVPEYNGHTISLPAPYLTQNGDSIYQSENYVYYGGNIQNTVKTIAPLVIQSDVTGPFSDAWSLFLPTVKDSEYTGANSWWSEEVREDGVADSAVVFATGEYIPKPVATYTVSKMNCTAYIEGAQNATFVAKIVRFNPETGYIDLEDPIAVGKYKLAADVSWSRVELKFEFVHYDEDGMESTEPVAINEPVLVLIDFSDPAIEEFRPYMNAYKYVKGKEIPELTAYTLLTGYQVNEDESLTEIGTIYSSASRYLWGDDGLLPYSFFYGMDITYPVMEVEEQRVEIPAEGGDVTVAVYASETSNSWLYGEAPDYDFDLPEWFTYEAEDYNFVYEQNGPEYYAGVSDLTITAEPLAEGETGRYYDLKISIIGAEKVIRIIQGEVEEPAIKGDVTGDGQVNASDIAAVVDVIAGNEDESKFEGRADVNGDGQVNASDIAAVVDIISGVAAE